MTYPSFSKRWPALAGIGLAALLLVPAVAWAQIGAGALTGTNTYEGREEGETIPINLGTASFGKTLPFDVNFKVSGPMPPRFGRSSRVDARFVEFKRPPDCASFFNQYTLTRQTLSDLNETDAIPVRRRRTSSAIEQSGFRQATIFDASGVTLQAGMVPIGGTGQGLGDQPEAAPQGATFLVDFPALKPNHYYCFQFIARRALSDEDLEALHKAFEKAVDEELRKDKYQQDLGDVTTFRVSIEDYEDMRDTLSATIEEQLAHSGQVVLAPPDSFFNVGARLQDITTERREKFEQISVRTVEGRLTAINEFKQKVADAVAVLRELAEMEFQVERQEDGQTVAGPLTGKQLVQSSENAQIRELGTKLLALSAHQFEERFAGVPEGMSMAPALEDTWLIAPVEGDAEGEGDGTLSIQERIDNIQELQQFLDLLASAAATRKIDLTGEQANVTPLSDERVAQLERDIADLKKDLTDLGLDPDTPADGEPPAVGLIREKIASKTTQLETVKANIAAGAVAPEINLMVDAAELLAEAVTQLQLLQEILEQRSDLIGDWVRQVLVEEQASLVVGATTVADYDTRAIWYMSADIGSGISELEDFFTYVGWNIYLRPVNKKSHLSWTARPFGLTEELLRRFSFTIGVVQTGFDEEEGRYEGVIGSNAAVLGAGLRINDSLRFSVGGLLFESQDPDPLVDSSRLEFSPYVAISLDWNIGASFSGLLGGGGG